MNTIKILDLDLDPETEINLTSNLQPLTDQKN